MLRLIAFYRRWVSPLLPPRCRFVPSCSAYAAEAIELYGTRRGGWLAACRVCRCHPFHPGGFDPVPQPHEQTSAFASGCDEASVTEPAAKPTDRTKS